ncbi:LSM domain protein [Staphylococcus sp. EG-SA-13]|nr:LSM domain protein [Staphylococcus sp. EG-SA-13]
MGKIVLIEADDGQKFTGKVITYDDEMDNESGEYSIYLDTGIQIYDFDESEINSIEILD